ncbi:MAG TPA: glycosyltransferase family 4 protein [Stenomitos sp.]
MNNNNYVNIAVCGRFHYHNYIEQIYLKGLLNKFYYSHPRDILTQLNSTGKIKNYKLKEYLTRLHLRLMGNSFIEELYPIYHDIWQFEVLKNWTSSKVLHILLHGTGIKLIQKAKQEGTVVLGDLVNSHPMERSDILTPEYLRLGIQNKNSRATKIPLRIKRLISEVELCDYYLSPSTFVTNSYVKRGIPEKKIFTVPYGINYSRFYTNKSKVSSAVPSLFTVVCTGSISVRKGQIYLLEAWKKLKLQNAQLILIGKIEKDILSIIEPYRKLFIHYDYVDNAELIKIYNSCKLFILPTLEEGLAVSILEALGCGLPVITTPNSGASTLIKNNAHGYIIPSFSSQVLADKILHLFNHSEELENMRCQVIKDFGQNLSWENYAIELQTIYSQLIGI